MSDSSSRAASEVTTATSPVWERHVTIPDGPAGFTVRTTFPTNPDGVEVMLDTFMDIDRGYYVRHGLVDRALNWRGAGRWLAQQAAALRRGDGA
jgi:hypothetical protein